MTDRPKKAYFPPADTDIAAAIAQTMEMETGKKIFTIRIYNDHKDELSALIVFEDKEIMDAQIKVIPAPEGQIGCRIKGKFIQ